MDTSPSVIFDDCKAMAKKEKTHKCNQCDYSSLWAKRLRAHLKTHSGEKAFKCNQCDYASVEKRNLNRHLKTHIRK